jgi:hypothetical protein
MKLPKRVEVAHPRLHVQLETESFAKVKLVSVLPVNVLVNPRAPNRLTHSRQVLQPVGDFRSDKEVKTAL